MIVFSIIMLSLVVAGLIIALIKKHYNNSSPLKGHSNPPPPPKIDKIGIYKGTVEITVPKAGYQFVTENKAVKFTAQVKEVNRFGDEIEVKYLALLNIPRDYIDKIMSVLEQKHNLIPIKDVVWEYDMPDVILDRKNLRKLLNKNEIIINDIHIRIDEEIDRAEILDIVIGEIHG